MNKTNSIFSYKYLHHYQHQNVLSFSSCLLYSSTSYVLRLLGGASSQILLYYSQANKGSQLHLCIRVGWLRIIEFYTAWLEKKYCMSRNLYPFIGHAHAIMWLVYWGWVLRVLIRSNFNMGTTSDCSSTSAIDMGRWDYSKQHRPRSLRNIILQIVTS